MLGTIDVNASGNGGTNNEIYNALLELYNTKNEPKEDRRAYLTETFVPLCDVDIIVIQFTNIFRDVIVLDGVTYPLQNMSPNFDSYVDTFIKNNMTLEDFYNKASKQVVEKFKILFEKIEEKNPNVKIRVFSWEDEIDAIIRNDEYFKDKVIEFNYNGKTFKTLRDIIHSYEKLTIAEVFTRRCIGDQHMNLEGHTLIAESIYKTI
jgi:hypothetical protein